MAKNKRNYNKGNNKNKKPNQYQGKREDKQEKSTGASYSNPDTVHSNDPTWWNRAASVFIDAVRVPFNRLTGYTQPINFGIERADGAMDGPTYLTNPSLMVLEYIPGIGVASTYTDAPNRAFQQIYSKIYSMTTGAVQFTQADISMFCVAMQSIAQNIALVKRAINTASVYSSVNGTYPREVLNVMGFNADDIIDNLADYRLQANNAILDFNSLPVLNNFPVYARQYMLANSIFLDEEGARSQTYIFRPSVYYYYSDLGVYDPDTEEYDGVARCIAQKYPWATTVAGDPVPRMRLYQLIDIINNQIRMIRTSSNFALMAGNIMKAFPDSLFLRIGYITETDVQAFTANDPWVSYQIHNLTFAAQLPQFNSEHTQPNFGTLAEFEFCPTLDITSDPVRDILKYQPKLQMSTDSDLALPWSAYSGDCDRIMNTFESDISPDFIMEASRFMVSGYIDPGTESPRMYNVTSCSTEIICGISMAYITGPQDNAQWRTIVLTPTLSIPGTATGEDIVALERFHKGPRLLVNSVGTTPGEIRSGYQPTGDLHLWTTISNQQLEGINNAALLSIFGIQS